MAKRSRLGKGLGALFPALPGETPLDGLEDVGSGDPQVAPSKQASATLDKAETKEVKTSETVSAKTIRGKKAETSGGAKAGKESRVAAAKSEAGNSSKTSSAAGSGKPNSSKNVSRETSAKKSRINRMPVPQLSELEHPSDLFFGAGDDTAPNGSGASAGDTGKSTVGAVVGAAGESAADNDLQPVAGGYLAELNVDDIRANSEQPRRIFDEDELLELSRSITEVGLLQPIVVRKAPKKPVRGELSSATTYEIIMGERRWRASVLAGLKTIPAIVKTTTDDEMLRDALLENLHRVALNPLEEAAAYQQMMDEFGMTQEELSKSISKSRPQIANTLRLLKLPLSVQKKVESGVLSAGHARALLTLPTEADMEALADRIIAEGLSVRSTEELVALKTHASEKKPRKRAASAWAGSPILHNLEDRFETKVDIKGSERRGRIEITFSSPDDMNRILSLLLAGQGSSLQGSEAANHDGWV
ncbi:chromosome partitioning protein ParB [Bifidobacterium actinocoloniiforme DSM 22766]|uniref:Chromosome partitioning protein ParB n=1 Tax=Bifidobacterium actinocoloniiforme DSM 22766 TaxID=1437605 RepID=A0A086Z2M8_9BIFI|nr:ParB/RepB/Spo0J family partition protein [Bifidobacterium actinocoloniiforme]AKV55751.1 hypothetical protein AB656_05725 [Bifidobacterium actinocoloniiforme DSM 22766]KFI40778.1 chromosome partitioning protein ParB [Bifidobacterium actinocoloniiforme DSM 22766]